MDDQEVPPDLRARVLALIEERRRIMALTLLREETGLSGPPLLDCFNRLRYEVLSRGVPADVEALARELIAGGMTRRAAWEVWKRTDIGYSESADYVRLLKDLPPRGRGGRSGG